MTIIERVFGWRVAPPKPVVTEPASPRSIHPEAKLQQILGATFEQLERDAEARATHGLPPGVIEEIRDANGALLTLRAKRYSSMVEAGTDARVQAVDDPEARRLAALAARWVLRRALKAIA